MAKKGRPFKENAIRKPCGESTGEEMVPPPFNLVGLQQRERQMNGKLVKLLERVPELYRLYSEGRIREEQRLAGEEYALLVRHYRRMLDSPKWWAAIASMGGGTSGSHVDWDLLSSDEQKAMTDSKRALERKYDKVFVLLIDRFNGINTKRAVDKLCLLDESLMPQELHLARIGLFDLAKHFGLAKRKFA